MSKCQHDFYYSDLCSRCGESATDLVKELEQENARLTELNAPGALKATLVGQQEQIAALEQDNARLRETLKQIASCESVVDGDVVMVARKALAEGVKG